jgi:hypothetical protein
MRSEPAELKNEGLRFRWSEGWMVGLGGVEPPTSSLSGIEGSALCGPPFPQVTAERQGRRDAFKRLNRKCHQVAATIAHTVRLVPGEGSRPWRLGRRPQSNPGRCPSTGPSASVSLPRRPGHRLDLSRPATPPPCPASLQRYDHCPGTPVVVLRAPHPRPGGVKQIAGPTMHRERC